MTDYSDPEDMPRPLDPDAPSPDEAEGDSIDRSIRLSGQRYIGATYDGDVYCLDCINLDYLKYGIEDPYRIPHGGPYPLGTEVDCPGSYCGNCLRQIEGVTVLHYDAVCHPDSCPDMTVHIADGDGSTIEAAELRRDDAYREVMFREDCRHGDRGNTMMVHERDLRGGIAETNHGP